MKQQILEQELEEDKTLISMLIAICKREDVPEKDRLRTIEQWLTIRLANLNKVI